MQTRTLRVLDLEPLEVRWSSSSRLGVGPLFSSAFGRAAIVIGAEET